MQTLGFPSAHDAPFNGPDVEEDDDLEEGVMTIPDDLFSEDEVVLFTGYMPNAHTLLPLHLDYCKCSSTTTSSDLLSHSRANTNTKHYRDPTLQNLQT